MLRNSLAGAFLVFTSRPALQFFVAALTLTPFYAIFWHSLSGDAAIYFTFVKRFFSLPFSFQPDMVTFGATSPLHVFVHAPVYRWFGDAAWLRVSKGLNLLLIPLGLVFLNLAVRGTLITLLLGCLVIARTPQVMISASQLFETPLAFLGISVLYFAVKTGRLKTAAFIAGLLYLIRPELLLVSVLVDIGIAWHLRRSSEYRAFKRTVLLSFAPAVAYHLYMLLMTGAWLPSSVYARGLGALESAAPWGEALAAAWAPLGLPEGQMYRWGAVCAGLIALSGRAASYRVELALASPLLGLYVLVPPGGYLPRYIVPVLPVIIAVLSRLALDIWPRTLGVLSISSRLLQRASRTVMAVMFVVLLHRTAVVANSAFRAHPRYDYDTLLLKDLASELNQRVSAGDAVLLYEIQGQYYLRARALSLDGIVGGEVLNALTGRESFYDFLNKNRDVAFVVTANALNMRKIYADTLMERLYVHDLGSSVGDTLTVGSLLFVKTATNPVFSDPAQHQEVPWARLNVGNTIRVYAATNRLWAGHVPLWNSVYRVERLSGSE